MTNHIKETENYLNTRYGLKLTLKESAEFLRLSHRTLLNKHHAGTLEFKTFKEGRGVYAYSDELAAFHNRHRHH